MADYCSAGDVSALLGFDTFTVSSRPTLAQVNSIIGDVTNEIDFTLSSIGITTQPTDARLLGRLAIACKYGVACQVAMSAYGNSTGVDGSQGDKFCEKYQLILDDIKTNPQLYGVVTGDSGMFLSNNVADGTNTETEIKELFLPENFEV